jgi:hypothetical protein
MAWFLKIVFANTHYMNTIYYLPSAEKRHFMQCGLCRDYVDRRNLNEVFHHETGDCLAGVPGDDIIFSLKKQASDVSRVPETPGINQKIKAFLSQLADRKESKAGNGHFVRR